MKIYLAGPMSGLPDLNYPEFNRVTALLEGVGLKVRNPAQIDTLFPPLDCGDQPFAYKGKDPLPMVHNAGVTDPKTLDRCVVHTPRDWVWYMRKALAMLLECDGLALLPGWSTSRGARIERELADALGFPVARASTWLQLWPQSARAQETVMSVLGVSVFAEGEPDLMADEDAWLDEHAPLGSGSEVPTE